MVNYFWRKKKLKFINTCRNFAKRIVKKLVILVIFGIGAVYMFSEIKLWVKNESEKMLRKSYSSGIHKLSASPKEIKAKIKNEIIEKDMVVLKKELERLKDDFQKRDFQEFIRRLKRIEDKIQAVKKRISVEKDGALYQQWLLEIENTLKIFKNKMHKDYADKKINTN